MKGTLLAIGAVIAMFAVILGLFTGVVLAVTDSPKWLLLALPYPVVAILINKILK